VSAPSAAAGPRRRPRHREDVIQRHVVTWLRWVGPRLKAIWFHVPNGGGRSAIEAAIFKGLGVTAGAPDLVFLWGGGCACMEVKAEDGRLSPGQVAFREACEQRGIPYAVVRNIDEAQTAVTGWGLIKPWEPGR